MTASGGDPANEMRGWSAPGQPSDPTPTSPSYLPPERSTNGLAIASLVLGILWLYWIGSILALILGYVARAQIKKRGQSGAGLATAGIVLGWVGVLILLTFTVFLRLIPA